MSLSSIPKLKYPEYVSNIKNGNNAEITKDNESLIKRMKNLKINKYANYLKDNKRQTNFIQSKIKKETSGSKKEHSNDKETQNNNDQEIDDTTVLDSSLASYIRSGKYSNAYLKDNYNKEEKLEVIQEQDTQRTKFDSNTKITSSHNEPKKIYSFLPDLENLINMSQYSIKNNPQFTTDYMIEIYNNLLEEEKIGFNLSGYMFKQIDINEKMRAILIDWIIDVHHKFKLTTETLFLGVHLLDKYLSLSAPKRDKLQLIGVVALMIACKYEEIFSPELRDFEYITDMAFDKEEMKGLESEMLRVFKFEVTFPSSLRFFEIISTILKFNKQDISFGKFLLELFLLDYRSVKYNSSLIANTVCFLVINLKKCFDSERSCVKESKKLNGFFNLNKENILKDHRVYLKTDVQNLWEKNLKECSKDICFILENIDNIGLHSVKKKFMSEEFDGVAKYASNFIN